MAAQSWLYWALASAIFAAMTAIFAKLGLQGVDSDFATFIRTLVITGASWLAYFKALQMGDASQVAPIDKLSVVLVAVFAVVFLGERPNGQAWLGIALVAAGVLVLAVKR